MALAIHLSVLASVVAATAVLVAWDRGRPQRSVGKLLAAVLPLVLIGGLCGLLMSATGIPVVEWVLPTLAVLIVGLFCPSDRIFNVMRWAMLLAAVVLCANFTSLVHGGFTAAPAYSKRVATVRQKVMISAAGKALRKNFPPQTVLPAGPVGKILDDPQFDTVDIVSVERQWHTPLTRLYRLQPQRASLWYPGGEVNAASQRLELRTNSRS